MQETTPVCCDPCADAGTCAGNSNCCVECHFSYEEEVALPYLPAHLQQRLRDEHRDLARRGMPREDVIAHGRRENAWFAQYCPPEVCALIEGDHDLYEQGKLQSQPTALVRQARVGALLPPPPRRLEGLISLGNSRAALRAVYAPVRRSSG